MIRELQHHEVNDVSGGHNWVAFGRDILVGVLGNLTYDTLKNWRIDGRSLRQEELDRMRDNLPPRRDIPTPTPGEPDPGYSASFGNFIGAGGGGRWYFDSCLSTPPLKPSDV